jgi:hypothetical protein
MPETAKKQEQPPRSSTMIREKKSLISQIEAVRRALAAKTALKLAEKEGMNDSEHRTKKD